MNLSQRPYSGKVIFFLLFLTVFLIFNGFAQEEKSCEKALENCVDDAENLLPNLTLFTNFVGYCVVGYVFCKKYIDR